MRWVVRLWYTLTYFQHGPQSQLARIEKDTVEYTHVECFRLLHCSQANKNYKAAKAKVITLTVRVS